ncbi:MAG: sodium:alanine symporter family protein [Phycisphaerae bacterium]|nr:sodium:alanine symporter family protein [Phycisphaerae bacterium]
MLEQFTELIGLLNKHVLWGPPMMILLVGVGLYLMFRIRFLQFTKFGLMWRETAAKIFRRGSTDDGDVTPFQAMSVAMGGTVGVGNIAGVASAIAVGGPGAIFWMWISGVVGMGTKFAEVTLGVHYRERDGDGPMMGGPMMYILRGMGKRWKPLAVLFCIFGALAGLGIGNMVQVRALTDGVEKFCGASESTGPLWEVRWWTGGLLVLAIGLVTLGGIKRIANVAMFCVPFMCTLYMLAAFVVIAMYITDVPQVLAMIVHKAFTPTAAVGGFLGSTLMLAMRQGIARGVFSNEAGLGSSPMAHATAKTDHPARQGLWGIFEVFFDTIVMCTATALVILLTGVWTSGEKDAVLTISAFSVTFGDTIGIGLVTLCMILTAYDTILAWCFYGETCCSFVLGHSRIVRMTYRVLWLPFILIGALWSSKSIWAVADTLNALMAIPNLIALFALTGVVVWLTRGFLKGEPYTPPVDEDSAES